MLSLRIKTSILPIVFLLTWACGPFSPWVCAQNPVLRGNEIQRLPKVRAVSNDAPILIPDPAVYPTTTPTPNVPEPGRWYPPVATDPMPSFGRPTAAPLLSLSDACAIALSANREVVAAQFETSAAVDRLAAIGSKNTPSLALFADYSMLSDDVEFSNPRLQSIGSIPLTGDRFGALGGNLSIPIYRGGKSAGEKRIGLIDIDLAELKVRQTQRALRLQVVEAFTHVLRCQSQARLAHCELLFFRSSVHDASRSKIAGAISNVENLKIQAGMEAAAYQAEVADVALAEARFAMNRLLGQHANGTINLQVPNLPVMSTSINEWLGAAMGNREELQQLRASMEQLRRQADTIRRGADPHVYVRGNAVVHDNEFIEPNALAQVSLSLDWSLFDGGRRENEAAALEKNAASIAMNTADIESKVDVEVRSALRKWLASKSAIRAALAGVQYQLAERTAVEMRTQQGMTTRTDTLGCQRDLFMAEHRHNEALLDAIVLGHQLRFSAGL